jgi:hypothetical protein
VKTSHLERLLPIRSTNDLAIRSEDRGEILAHVHAVIRDEDDVRFVPEKRGDVNSARGLQKGKVRDQPMIYSHTKPIWDGGSATNLSLRTARVRHGSRRRRRVRSVVPSPGLVQDSLDVRRASDRLRTVDPIVCLVCGKVAFAVLEEDGEGRAGFGRRAFLDGLGFDLERANERSISWKHGGEGKKEELDGE